MESIQTIRYELCILHAYDESKDWIDSFLLPEIGLSEDQVIYREQFRPGAKIADEYQDAIKYSRYTLVELSEKDVSDWNAYATTMRESLDVDNQEERLIPILFKGCDTIPDALKLRVSLDFTNERNWSREALRLRELLELPEPVQNKIQCPYPGMKPFQNEQQHLFFGREVDIEDLQDKLAKHSLVAIMGASGSGKSSLINAGLIPKLQPIDFEVIRPSEISRVELRKLLKRINESLSKSSKNYLLVIDQFEEVFSRSSKNDRRNSKNTDSYKFQRLLLRFIEIQRNSNGRKNSCAILLAIRLDFHVEIADVNQCPLWERYLKYEKHRQYITPLNDKESLEHAIIKPAKAVGVTVEQALVNQLLFEATGEPGPLPLLQQTMTLLWKGLTQKYLSFSVYEELSKKTKQNALENRRADLLTGFQSAISIHANQTLEDIGIERVKKEKIARRIFVRLIQFDEDGDRHTRRQQLVDNLRSENDDDSFDRILGHLVSHNLLVMTGDRDLTTKFKKVELAHEALIKSWDKFRIWIQEFKVYEQRRRQLEFKAWEWEKRLNRKGGLLDAVELDDAKKWQEENLEVIETSQIVNDLILESEKAVQVANKQEKEQKEKELRYLQEKLRLLNLLQMLSWILGFFALGSFCLKLYADRQKREALSQSLIAQAKDSDSLFNFNKQLDSIVAAVRVAKQAKGLHWNEKDVPVEVKMVLLQSVYGVKEYNRLEGHAERVFSTAFSPNGKILASASSDGTVQLWNEVGEKIASPLVHGEFVYTVSFSPDGKLLASAGNGGKIKFWSLDKNTIGTSVGETEGHDGTIYSISFSFDGKSIAAASSDKTVKLFDVATKKRIHPLLKGHTGEVFSVAFSPTSNKILASASTDKKVKIWNISGSTYSSKTCIGHQKEVEEVNFSPDGKKIVSSSRDNTIWLWGLDCIHQKTLGKTDNPFGREDGHNNWIYSVQFSPNGKMLASGSADSTIKLWDLEDANSSKELVTLKGHQATIYRVRFSPDGKTLASASEDRTVRLWDLTTKPHSVINEGNSPVTVVRFSPDGKMLASAADNGTINIRRYRSGVKSTLEKPQGIRGHQETIGDLSFSADSKTLASASTDTSTKLWSVDTTGNLREVPSQIPKHRPGQSLVSFSLDGKKLALTDQTNLLVTDVDGQKPQYIKQISNIFYPYTIAFSNNNKFLAVGSKDYSIWLISTGKGQAFKLREAHTEPINSVIFSPDNKILASASDDKTIRLWKISALTQEPEVFKGHQEGINSVRFSSDGRLLFSASSDRTIKLWSMDDRKFSTSLTWTEKINDLSISSNDATLVAASGAGNLVIWSLSLDNLLTEGCNKIKNYLQTNSNLSSEDKHLCDNTFVLDP
jgi:WD40 repeat protein/energy-coupling factor transporter ATP-binding protein EcfA2